MNYVKKTGNYLIRSDSQLHQTKYNWTGTDVHNIMLW